MTSKTQKANKKKTEEAKKKASDVADKTGKHPVDVGEGEEAKKPSEPESKPEKKLTKAEMLKELDGMKTLATPRAKQLVVELLK